MSLCGGAVTPRVPAIGKARIASRYSVFGANFWHALSSARPPTSMDGKTRASLSTTHSGSACCASARRDRRSCLQRRRQAVPASSIRASFLFVATDALFTVLYVSFAFRRLTRQFWRLYHQMPLLGQSSRHAPSQTWVRLASYTLPEKRSRRISADRASACPHFKKPAIHAYISEVELKGLLEEPNGAVQGVRAAHGVLHTGDRVGDRSEPD